MIVFFNYNIYNTQLTCAFAVQPANCNPALPRVTSGILAQYNLNDSSYDPSTLVANNQFLNTFGSISNLALTDSSLWCTTSAGLCFNTGRSNSMGAFSQLFSPSTFGELSLSSGDFTTEVWFVASKNTGNGYAWYAGTNAGAYITQGAIEAVRIIDISGNNVAITGNFHLYGLAGT